MDYTKIISKLIGPIEPVGETNTDDERFESLEQHCILIEELIMKVQYVANTCKNRQERSMKKAGQYAYKFLDRIGIEQ